MVSSRSPGGLAGLILPACLCLLLCAAGCVLPLPAADPSADPLAASGNFSDSTGNGTGIAVPPDDLPGHLKTSLAGPGRSPARTVVGPAAALTPSAADRIVATGPALTAKGGSEVNITEVVLGTETILPE